MYEKVRALVFCGFIVLVLSASSAYADMKNGLYIGAGGGFAMLNDSDWKDSNGDSGDLEYDSGYVFNVSMGYKFGMTRLEGEILYQKNDIDKLLDAGVPVSDITGDTSALSCMMNGYVDFANKTAFTPFITAGIGMTKIDMDLSVAGSKQTDDDDIVFAYQVGAGIAMDLSPNFILDFTYRYFGASDPEFTDITNVKSENEFSSHNISIGIRYSF